MFTSHITHVMAFHFFIFNIVIMFYLADTLPPTLPPCVDVEDNCPMYGKTACTQYQTWSLQHCRKFCGFCGTSLIYNSYQLHIDKIQLLPIIKLLARYKHPWMYTTSNRKILWAGNNILLLVCIWSVFIFAEDLSFALNDFLQCQ